MNAEITLNELSSLETDLQRAIHYHQANNWADAKKYYQAVLCQDPDHPLATLNSGALFLEIGEIEAGLRLMDKATTLARAQCNTDVLLFIGNALNLSERLIEAKAVFRQVLEIEPTHIDALCNLGVTLDKLGRFADARECYSVVLQINHEHIASLRNLGSVQTELGQLAEAESCYREVLRLTPDCDKIHFALALVLLFAGNFSEGWRRFDYRWKGGRNQTPYPDTVLPQWTGQMTHPGESILIFGEQGMGDRIQFSRYLNLLTHRFSGKVSVILNRELTVLFQRSFPDCEFLESVPADQSKWQWQCALMSLPLAFNTTLDTIPGSSPYLTPDSKRVAYFKKNIARLTLPATIRKIGVVWKCGVGTVNSGLRSIPFELLAPLFDQRDVIWFNLQKEPGQDRQKLQAVNRLIDWSDEFSDFDYTAALIMNLDLVITVDTSVAHLAGALGKPVWLLNRFASEWRWMRDRKDSPWYPTTILFNQCRAGDWEEVIGRACSALAGSQDKSRSFIALK